MGKLTAKNQVLLGHVIATFSVKSFTECFTHCDDDCRCRSFNLPLSGEGQCELNSADNSTVLLQPKRGWRYHHLQMKEVLSGAVSFVFACLPCLDTNTLPSQSWCYYRRKRKLN